jgi:hypothetical protein
MDGRGDLHKISFVREYKTGKDILVRGSSVFGTGFFLDGLVIFHEWQTKTVLFNQDLRINYNNDRQCRYLFDAHAKYTS